MSMAPLGEVGKTAVKRGGRVLIKKKIFDSSYSGEHFGSVKGYKIIEGTVVEGQGNCLKIQTGKWPFRTQKWYSMDDASYDLVLSPVKTDGTEKA